MTEEGQSPSHYGPSCGSAGSSTAAAAAPGLCTHSLVILQCQLTTPTCTTHSHNTNNTQYSQQQHTRSQQTNRELDNTTIPSHNRAMTTQSYTTSSINSQGKRIPVFSLTVSRKTFICSLIVSRALLRQCLLVLRAISRHNSIMSNN